MVMGMGIANMKEDAMRKLQADSERVKKQDALWEKKIYSVLYVGMSKEEFKEKFSENILKETPYIIYFHVPGTGEKARVTFENNRLVKYELLGSFYGIPGTGHYSNATSTLRE